MNIEKPSPKRIKVIWLILLLGTLNGTTLISSRFSIGQFHTVNYLLVRTILSSLCYLLFFTFSKKQEIPREKEIWKHGLIVGLMGSYSMISIIMAMNYISSGLNSIIMASGPALTFLLAHFLLDDEKLSARKIFGIGLALSGALAVVLLGESGLAEFDKAEPIGYFLVISGMSMGSISSIYIRKFMSKTNSIQTAFVRNLMIFIVMIVLSFVWAGFDFSNVKISGILTCLYASVIGTFCAHLLMMYITQYYGASQSSLSAYVLTVVAIIGGYLLLGEKVSFGMLFGMSLIVAGIAVLENIIKFSKK